MLRKQNWANTAKTRAYYISFYNSMWLVANDIIIGLAIGSFLMANNAAMAEKLHRILHKYTVESLHSMMLWFLESPAGLKLNHELGSFLSELFLWLIRLWTLSARIFNWQLVILNSLFNLFRGKKRNILRNRIDSCDYDLDQLLLGTSLFTLLTFLFPTVLIYYLTFALGRVGVIFLQAVMETILAFFNHFPLFAIMLRLKDPHRLPGGLEFEIFSHDNFLWVHHGILHRIKQIISKFKRKETKVPITTTKKMTKKSSKKRSLSFNIPGLYKKKVPHLPIDASKGAYLWMRNMPIPLGAIFFQYMLLWKRLSAHYFSAYVFNCLLYGEPIKPIPKLQVFTTTAKKKQSVYL
ncbi:N-acetylglucosaminyl transferase component-domain-containing protein [Pilaira anomala]|nr:N-acetylglucosaminyl transferase component-domain-containing protein [Pilaira anomala]